MTQVLTTRTLHLPGIDWCANTLARLPDQTSWKLHADGWICQAAGTEGGRCDGCDLSLSALPITPGKLFALGGPPLARLVQGDAQRLPFADSSFDIVVSCETIEHVPLVQAAISEMYRITRPGGKLFLTTPNYFNFMGVYEIYARFRHPDHVDDQPFDRRQWFLQIHKWIRQSGWTILGTDGTVHQFPFFPGHNPIRWENLEANRTIRKMLSPFAY